MSRTIKKYRTTEGHSTNFNSKKQALRDNMRHHVKYRDVYKRHRRSGHTDIYWHVVRRLFANGLSLEHIRKVLIDKHRCTSHDANNIIKKFGPTQCWYNGGGIMKVNIEGIVCVRDGYVVPAATSGLEPYFMVSTDLPIYYWADWETHNVTNSIYYSIHYYDGGNVVYMDGKIYKFVMDLDKTRSPQYRQEDDYQQFKLKVWPNKTIPPMIGEVINLHMQSGMEHCSFKIHGWKKLRYLIETVHTKD